MTGDMQKPRGRVMKFHVHLEPLREFLSRVLLKPVSHPALKSKVRRVAVQYHKNASKDYYTEIHELYKLLMTDDGYDYTPEKQDVCNEKYAKFYTKALKNTRLLNQEADL